MSEAGTPTRLNWRGRLLAATLIMLALFQCVVAIRAATRPPEITTIISLIPALEITAALVWGGLAGWAFLRLVRMRRAAVGCGVIAARTDRRRAPGSNRALAATVEKTVYDR
jgi:hypothetical protein